MSRMADEQAELAELRAITRPRLLATVIADLRETAAIMHATAAGPKDRREATGLLLLLEMHDKLEAHGRGD